MSFIDDSINNVKLQLMKEVSGGGVAGFTGRAGMGIDALFAGPYHPDSGHGSQNEKLLAKQISDRKKQRAEMEKQAYEDGVELVGVPDPIGGWFADIGETEGIELAYEELADMGEIHKQFNDDMTPPAETEWKSTGWDYDYDEFDSSMGRDRRNRMFDDDFINQSEENTERIVKYDDNSYNNPIIKDIKYDDNSSLYTGEDFINQSQTNWKIINRG